MKNTAVLSSVFSRKSCQISNYPSSYSSYRPMPSYKSSIPCVDSELFQSLKAKFVLFK